jgi:hypothetical protein
LAAACSSGDDGDAAPEATTGGAPTDGTGAGSDDPTFSIEIEVSGPDAAELCGEAEPVAATPPTVASDELDETSGLAASADHPGVLWAHDDSGGAAELHAIGPDGGDLGVVDLAPAGVENVDWEDLALAPGPRDGADVLVVGDIGDNRGDRDHVTLYRVPEPAPPGPGGRVTATGVEAVEVVYDSGSHDAEALLSDPRTGEVTIVDKDWNGVGTGAWPVPAGTGVGSTPSDPARVTVERAGDVALPQAQPATSADVSPDGVVVAVRTYTSVLLWDRESGESIAAALAGEPCTAPSAPENQGEALAFAPDDRGYVTVSEGAHPAIHAFRQP